jgi:ABC-type branched-subunit amino acid transport system substrate-binding protein
LVDLIEQVALDQQDFKSLIVKIKNRPYDALGVFLISGQVGSFFKQSAVQGLRLPTFGADFFGSQTEIAAAGESINGSVFPDLGVSKEFQQRYLKRFGNDIQIAFAANAYDVATMVGALFGNSESSSMTSDQIVVRIKSSKNFSGAHGSYHYEDSPVYGPMMTTPIAIKGIRNNAIVELETR